MDVAIDAGADDVVIEDGQIEVITAVAAYHSVLSALEASNIEVEQSHITMRAQTMVPLDNDSSETLEKLIDMLEDLDDVQAVYSNAEFPDSCVE
jgi:transcriptional/translational regulatory protein YebC/TACO1